ncbi:MAG: hypothetical protein PVF76_08025 [Syntrophobacterales bacterium]|jgi:hypothetical protein
MDERVLRKSLLWSVILVLAAILGIAVSPCSAAESSYTLQELLDGQTIEIDNLVFDNFDLSLNIAIGDATLPDPKNILVEKIGEGTLKKGLRFVLNDELSIFTPSQSAMRVIEISYQVRHHGGDFIEANSLVLDPLTVIDGNNARVSIREDIAYEQLDVIKSVIYEVKQNVSRQSSVGTVETPQATLLPTVSVSSFAPASGQASIDGFEQLFSVVPMIDAGDDQIVFDQVTLEPTGDPMYDSFVWELYRKDGDELVLVGSQVGKQTTFSNLENVIYTAKLIATNSQTVPAVDFVDIFAAGPCEAQPEPPQQADADLKVWGLKLKKYKRCKWSFARMYGTFDFPEVDLDHNGTVNAEVSIKLLGAKADGGDFLVKGKTACKVRDHKYKFVIRK